MTGPELRIDLETRSDVDLITRGVYVYAQSPHADVLLASYQVDDGPVKRWRRGQPCPDDIITLVEGGGTVRSFNAGFERVMWWHVLTPKHGWPKPRIDQFACSAATAAAMSLPRSLDRLGEALNLAVKKDRRGQALIRRFSLPRPPRDGEDPTGVYFNEPHEFPAEFEEFHNYCDTDLLAEREADRRLVPFSAEEQEVYTLNEIINDRGIQLDVRSARAAIKLAAKTKSKLDKEMTLATAGYVRACTQVGELCKWVESQGVALTSAAKADIAELLDEVDDLPDHVRHALEIRQEAAKTSVAKISAMLNRASHDGRIRGVYMHQGAGQSGRFSSTGAQLHNLPKYRKIFEDSKLEQGTLFNAIREECPDHLEFMYGPELGRPLHLLSDAIRGFLCAGPGNELIDADYSSIEGRMAAWFAGEEWKLEAFRALDRGEGPGMYEMAAAGIYNIPVSEVDKSKRAVGKVSELSLGYNGGCGALARMARDNKLKLDGVFGPVWESAPIERREKALERYEERLEKSDETAKRLGREGWLAAELVKVGWRAAHPAISGAWKLLDEAARAAVEEPGGIVSAVGVSYTVRHGFLWCRLPSGRCLAYGRPRVDQVEAPWADKTVEPAKREKKASVTVLGVDSQTKKWVRFPVYGGSLFNNVVQGSARDILVNGMQKAEAAGYPIVLHTHDEMAAEVPRGAGDVKEFERLICELPSWAAGLPLTASGWRGVRYKKD